MEKNAIKKFAVWAREELIKRCSTKAEEYGITQDSMVDAGADSINGKLLTDTQIKQRKALIEKIKKDGYEQVIEEVAYTWFNRFAALRFMEVNEVLPSRVRVFTDKDGAFRPQILAEALSMDLRGLDKRKVISLIEDNKTEDLYKYLLITQCNDLSCILPGMFQRIDDYTGLLFPDNLLRKDSVIDRMVRQGQSDSIPEVDWRDQVQIIGWLYQYYNSVPKDTVFANLKNNKKISKEDIPAATQLFTPDWIVRYMVENSLGRSVINNLTYDTWAEEEKAKIDRLKSEWRYYLDEAPQDEKVETELRTLEHHRYGSGDTQPFVDSTLIDPCMGSGHILVYAFDVYMQIYRVQGWSDREAVRRIIERNLFGLDIDERAAQLAYFAVMMKACQYDKRLLTRKDDEGNPNLPQPNVYAIPESGCFDKEGRKEAAIDPEALEYFVDGRSEIKANLEKLLEQMFNAKEYGSAIQIEGVDFDVLYARYDETLDESTFYRQTFDTKLLPLLRVAEMLSRQYDFVVTNPPYMGAGNMDATLLDFVKKNFPDYKSDLFSAFIVKCSQLAKSEGYLGFLTPYVWMFIQSYEKLRMKIYHDFSILTMVQLEYNAFENACVPVVIFALRKTKIKTSGEYIKLSEFKGIKNQEPKTLEAINNPHCGYRYTANQNDFSKIPGSPVAYWVSVKFLSIFGEKLLSNLVPVKKGMDTGDNDKFLRHWYEVSFASVDLMNHSRKWIPYDKGGDYRKWYGNNTYVLNWGNNGYDLRHSTANLRSEQLYFKESITWNALSSSNTSYRYSAFNGAFDSAGSSMFPRSNELPYYLGLMNSKIAQYVLQIINPTLNYGAGSVGKLPVAFPTDPSTLNTINDLVEQNIALSRDDWDSFETSWDFKAHPLVAYRRDLWDGTAIAATISHYYGEVKKVSCPLELCWLLWQAECGQRFEQLKKNEEELNRIFIDIYGLQDELTPEVDDKDVTVRKADLQRDIRSFISYAVGCMFGRYSLDREGLIFAGGNFDDVYWKYKGQAALDKNGDPIDGGYAGISLAEYHYPRLHDTAEYETATELTFEPDADNCIPITDDEYFTDDIVGRFVEFVKVVYGEDSLQANLKFIADALGGKGSPKAVIRNYFLNDFYADHLKIYQKRPIYWLFDSGKKNGFKALIYMHRYQPDTIARMRTDYVHEQQARYRTAIEDLERRITGADTAERVRLSKQLSKLKDQDVELRGYEEKIHHLADQMIRIDLDDGVKNNYEIFKDVLAKIK